VQRSTKVYNEANLLDLKTGDFIKARVIKLPLISHYGIVVVDGDNVMVYHNTPKKYNHLGGSIMCHNIDIWLKSREIISIINTDMTAEYIKNLTDMNIKKKFNLFNFNCEHYAFLLKDGKPKSPQLWRWIVAVGAILL
jgi:hypothetical protein